MAYYMNLFTEETWRESRVNARFRYTGHTERLRNRDQIQPGDRFICWVVKVSAAVGVLRVTSEAYDVPDEEPRTWRQGLYPVRFKTELETRVPLDKGVSLTEIREHSTDHDVWNWIFRNSGNAIPEADGSWIVQQLEERARRYGAALDGDDTAPPEDGEEDGPTVSEETAHQRIQGRLVGLARDMQLEVWVARNDRNVPWDGHTLGDLSVERLPQGLPDAARRTIELIDVVWLRRNEYVAAFEIESTTRIYSGLLRMADLVSLIPNLDVPLFVVAPEARRGKVFEELQRPVFSQGLQKPLAERCRFVSFENFEKDLSDHGSRVRAFEPRRYMDELAESAP